MLPQQPVHLAHLLVLELEGQPCFDFSVEFVLAEVHCALVDEETNAQADQPRHPCQF